MQLTAVDQPLYGGLLLSRARVCLLNIGKVSIDMPGQVGFDAACGVVGNRQRDTEPRDAHRVNGSEREGAMRDAIRVEGLVIPGLPAAAATEFCQLGVDVREGQQVRRDQRRFTRPRHTSVDFEPQRPEEAGFAKVVPGQRLVLAALAARAHHEQRWAAPCVELSGTNER
jgi:hypothetical protein